MCNRIPPPPKHFTGTQKEIYYGLCDQLLEENVFDDFDIESIYDAALILDHIDYEFKSYFWGVR